MNEEIEESLNEQINEELSSYYLYLSMQAYFATKSLDGFATWMELQAGEEVEHAMRIFRFLNDRGGRVKLGKIEEPKSEWDSPLAAFKDTYKHEQHITQKINELVDLAEEKDDKATLNTLDWFVEEQVEEEATAEAIVKKLEIVDGSASGLLALDKSLGSRQTTDSQNTEE